MQQHYLYYKGKKKLNQDFDLIGFYKMFQQFKIMKKLFLNPA